MISQVETKKKTHVEFLKELIDIEESRLVVTRSGGRKIG